MKKVLSFVLALVMVLALSVTAFAETYEGEGTFPAEGKSESTNIEATYKPHDDVVVSKYHVTVAWNTTGSISYTKGYTTYTWNPGDTKYDPTVTEAKWNVQNASIAITVTNRSDGAIKAECGAPVDKTDGAATIIGSYDTATNGTIQLATAAGATYTDNGSKQTGTATYTIKNVSGSISQSGTIATITVKVSAA